MYPPNVQQLKQREKTKHSFDQFTTQAADADAKFALTTSSFQLAIRSAALAGHFTSVKWLETDRAARAQEKDDNDSGRDDKADADTTPIDVAVVQYTSGSTSAPKGVMISHSALIHNLECIVGAVFQLTDGVHTKDFVAVSKMPQYHDYLLI